VAIREENSRNRADRTTMLMQFVEKGVGDGDMVHERGYIPQTYIQRQRSPHFPILAGTVAVARMGGIFRFFNVLYSTLFHLPSLRFHCAEGYWERTQDSCDFDLTTWLGLIHNFIFLKKAFLGFF
jgi:hypothetical protein